MPEWSRDIAISVISALIGAALVWIIGRITPDPSIRALGGHTKQEFGELQTQLSQKETQVAAITTQFNSAKAQLDNMQTQLGRYQRLSSPKQKRSWRLQRQQQPQPPPVLTRDAPIQRE